MNKRVRALIVALGVGIGVVAGIGSALAQGAPDKTKIKVGISAGNQEQIFDLVRKVAARDGLTIDVVVFNDYLQPNEALASGDLDANAFQHKPFLDSQIRTRGYRIVPVGLTITAPLGIYSKKYRGVDELPEGAKIGIQNDPSNGNRALLLLQKAGLIKLKAGVGQNGVNATPLDVVENPRKLKLVELDAAQLPRALPDLAAASINNDYAYQAGLSLQKDTIAIEDARGPYANLIAARPQDKDKPWVSKLVKAYQSDEVRNFINAQFKGSIIPAF
ncbi:MetQ/NlpA family ABC transporter substrate-binding protein [Cupriavidus sp. 2TAF22]|uniref:MetQ/NlpA family ABC transporter substrate-binding protein n=1 Tax=unclassified Cupriavidus TaxID=2640874 RepID=UPI003F92604F